MASEPIELQTPKMRKRRRLKYNLRLMLIAWACIWSVVLGFAFLVIKEEQGYRQTNIVERIELAASAIADAQVSNNDLWETVRFVKQYLDETYLNDIAIEVINLKNHEVIAAVGNNSYTIPQTVFEHRRETQPDGTRMMTLMGDDLGAEKENLYYYSSRITADGQLSIRVAVPLNQPLLQAAEISPAIWIYILLVGSIGSLLAAIVTSHQARNVSLLHDFAARAASDKDFIPIGDFPSDEIGEISRQIVAIYNSRRQANVRRDREHAIALKATQDKNNMKKLLTDNLSHELKTPIGIVKAYLEMLLSQPDMPQADRIHFLSKAHGNMERLTSMLNDLSTITRLDESGNNIQLKTIDFHSFVFMLIDEVTASDVIHGMDFMFNIPLDCEVVGNENLLNSVIQNLVKNAAAYSQGTAMGIEMIGRNERFYTFSFYDNGTGVSEEHLGRLFDRFYRVDTGRSRKTGGTGLGLPIVKSSINTMGGSIIVRNRKGGGLEFIFTLPRPWDNQDTTTEASGAPLPA